MKQKSRIKELAEFETKELIKKIHNLPRGGIAKLSRSTGVNKSTISRFKSGNHVNSGHYKLIEVAVRDDAA